MTQDLYQILGLAKGASDVEIRDAYRSLAKKYHPDLNPGDKAAEETFKSVQGAHEILSDPEKRRQYDAGEIDADGNERHRNFYREYAGAGDHPYSSTAGYEDLSDLFSEIFRGGPGEDTNIRMRGGDTRYSLEITFVESVLGAKKRVTMPDGNVLDIGIPPGHRDGQILRLKGKGMPGHGGGPAGDAYITVSVSPDARFNRRDQNILTELPISLGEAVLGGKVAVPTVSGTVTMTIPPGANTGDILRLKGKGVPQAGSNPPGDQLVTLRVVLPETIDDELKSFVESWSATHRYDPRNGIGSN